MNTCLIFLCFSFSSNFPLREEGVEVVYYGRRIVSMEYCLAFRCLVLISIIIYYLLCLGYYTILWLLLFPISCFVIFTVVFLFSYFNILYLSRGSSKTASHICIHSTFPRPYLWDFTEYIVVDP